MPLDSLRLTFMMQDGWARSVIKTSVVRNDSHSDFAKADFVELGREVGRDHPRWRLNGAVTQISPTSITISDLTGSLSVGARVDIEMDDEPLTAEVCRLQDNCAIALPFGSVDGLKRGARAFTKNAGATINPTDEWRGRIIDGMGQPIDGKGPLPKGRRPMLLRASPPLAPLRARLGAAIDFGVKAMTAFTPAREGQRLGLFAGSGIGKSSLLSMIARNTDCDIAVIALIGERGREVREFIEDSLGPEGLARSVVVVATSDEPALVRREAAFVAATIAEYFRDQGLHVLQLMDSITRVAAAQREIGLAAGEPPTSRGFTPSVFSLLPSLLERAGPGVDRCAGKDNSPRSTGAISGVFSVLVEGDDHDEPIADAARAILDGHIVLDRRISETGRFPAIDILKSVSRVSSDFKDEQEVIIRKAKAHAAIYDDMREMIRIGAYNNGANPEVDAAKDFHPKIERFLTQSVEECVSAEETFVALNAIVLGD